MKIYDKNWSFNVLAQFEQCNPRVVQINRILIETTRQAGYIITNDDIRNRLMTCIRVPSLGRFIWRDYKALIKRYGVPAKDELLRLFQRLRFTAILAQEDIDQIPLPLEND